MAGATPRRSWSAGALALTILCAALVTLGDAGAWAVDRKRGKPDLVVAKVTLPQQAAAGEELPVELVIRNRGNRRSPKSSASFTLSKDRSVSKKDKELPVYLAVPRIRPGAKKKLTAALTMPAGLTGARYVIACVSTVKGEKGRRAQNNCKATQEPLDIGTVPSPDSPAYYVGTATANHIYTWTTTATDRLGATWTQTDRDLTATDVVFERRTRQDGTPWYVAVDGEVEWRMAGGHIWEGDETCDYSGHGAFPVGERPAGTSYAFASISPTSAAGDMGPGASYALDDVYLHNGKRAPEFNLDCTEFDRTGVYIVDPWLTVLTSTGDESTSCPWTTTKNEFNALANGSLTGENSCRRETSRLYPNGTFHEYTFESSVSWDLQPVSALPARLR